MGRRFVLLFIVACVIFYLMFMFVITSESKVYKLSEIKHMIIVHPVKPDKPGKPSPPPEDPKDNNYYELLGLYLPDLPVTYYINVMTPEVFSAEILLSFGTWDYEISNNLFNYGGQTIEYWYQLDYENTISFVKFTPRDIVAFASIYYADDGDPNTLDPIIDFDIVFNSLLKWDIDSKKCFDVGNVATHEIGHALGLADLYDDIYSELTMYGYTSKGETKKETLEIGDILGVRYLYE